MPRHCVNLNVVARNTLIIDSSKCRAIAGIGYSCTPERCEKKIEQIDQSIDEIVNECEKLVT